MKKIFSILLVAMFILTACNSSKPNITELQSVPNKVQDLIKSDTTLQMINEGEKKTYIVFHSTEAVSVELEVVENVLNIKFNTDHQENKELKQYVYELNVGDSEHDTINVMVNGENTHFDGGVTIF